MQELTRLGELWPGIKYVQLVDGDCELETSWLSAAYTFMEENEQRGRRIWPAA